MELKLKNYLQELEFEALKDVSGYRRVEEEVLVEVVQIEDPKIYIVRTEEALRYGESKVKFVIFRSVPKLMTYVGRFLYVDEEVNNNEM